MANIYDEFIIVEEKTAMDFTVRDRCTAAECTNVRLCIHIDSKFVDLTAFASLEFKMVNSWYCLYIKDIASHSTNTSEPLAQIVSWKWEAGTQTIKQNITLNRGGTAKIDCFYSTSMLSESSKSVNPCPPLSSPDDDFTVHIGDGQVMVSASWLMVVSPVVKRMLSVEMKEKKQRSLSLDGHDLTMEQFMHFLETINDHLQHGRNRPNPTNVLDLLKLADYFQIDWLKERCDAHLINCVEIPLIERFLLIERYRLNKLRNFFLRCLNVDNLREFMRTNHVQLSPYISKEFLFELAIRQ